MEQPEIHFQNINLSATDIADIIWLASFIAPALDSNAQSISVDLAEPDDLISTDTDSDGFYFPPRFRRKLTQDQETSVSDLVEKSIDDPDYDTIKTLPIYHGEEKSKDSDGGWSGLNIKVPQAPAILEKAAIVRSLRPLQQRVPSTNNFILNEVDTAEQIAISAMGSGSWLPIRQPVQERWLDLIILVDSAPSMALWQQTIDELSTLLANTGLFRNVHRWKLVIVETEGTVNDDEKTELHLHSTQAAPGATPRHHSISELLDQQQRRLFIVISDCSSIVWDSGIAQQLLKPLAENNLLSLFQVLPESLWETTALKLATKTRLISRQLLSCNRQMVDKQSNNKNNYPIPVVSIEPLAIKTWAGFLAGHEHRSVSGCYLPTTEDVSIDIDEVLQRMGIVSNKIQSDNDVSIPYLYNKFRERVPVHARLLATYFAAIPLTLPIMRMVQATMLPNTTHADFVHVFYSGLIKRKTAQTINHPESKIVYDFAGGDAMRRYLLTRLPRYNAEELVDLVIGELSRYIQEHVDQSNSFDAVVFNQNIQGMIQIDDTTRHFAEVTAKVLSFLGGSNEIFTDNPENLILSHLPQKDVLLPIPHEIEEEGDVFEEHAENSIDSFQLEELTTQSVSNISQPQDTGSTSKKSIFGRLAGWLGNGGSQSKRQYFENLIYQHRYANVKGLATQGDYSLELSQVFVELVLGQQNRSGGTADLLQKLTPELMMGSHPVWDFLANKQLPYTNLVIIGAPGSGKTTLLKHIALSLVDGSGFNKPPIQKVPIMLFLRDLVPNIMKDQNFPLLRAVQNDQERWQESFSLDWLGEELQRKNCLILLDGLDEVANESARRQVAAWVDRQMRRFRGNQFVISSRPYGYEYNPLQNVLVLEVRPFSLLKVKQFVEGWYLADERMRTNKDDKGVRYEAQRGADDLLHRLDRTPVLRDLSVNPLLLTMIATIHRYRGVLPARRVDLFEEICEVFLGKRQQAKGLTFDLIPDQKRQVLEPLAYYMMAHQTREISTMEAVEAISPFLRRVSHTTQPEQFLKMIADTSGLLLERKPGYYSFANFAFQEYLASAHIRRNRLEHELETCVEDSWWHETIRLFSAKGDATNIIRACVAPRPKASVPVLTLALECLEESTVLSEDMRRLADDLAQMVENDNPDVRRVGAEVLLSMRMRRLMRVGENRYADSNFVTQAEYQLFLDEVRASGQYHQPDHWEGEQFKPGEGREPVAGIRPSDAEAFCQWLTKRDLGPWQYRLPTAEERDRLPIDENQATVNVGFWYRRGDEYHFSRGAKNGNDQKRVQQFVDKLENRFEQDLFLSHQTQNLAAVERARKHIKDRALQRRFALRNLERTLAIKGAPGNLLDDWQRILDRNTPAQAKELDIALDKAFNLLDDPHLDHARNIVLSDMRRIARELAESLPNISGKETYDILLQSIRRHLRLAHESAQKIGELQKRDLLDQRALLRYLGNAQQDAHSLVNSLDASRIDARTRLRAKSLQHVIGIFVALERQERQQSPLAEDTAVRKKYALLLSRYIDLYIDVALVEERINGNLPALEGLRFIRVLST